MIPPRIALYLGGAMLLAVLAFAAYRWAYDRGRDAERAVWQQATAEAGERFNAALMAQQATLDDTDRALSAARRQANRAREGLSDAITNDPAAADWSRQPIPDSVRLALDSASVPADPGGAH